MTREVKFVTVEEALKIVITRKPIGLFYTKENGKYVGIDNEGGEAWTEGFDTLGNCICWLKGEHVVLCTFPDIDDEYCKRFIVPADWLIETLEKMDNLNERKCVDLHNFLENYVFDETYAIYEMAKAGNHLIAEEECR